MSNCIAAQHGTNTAAKVYGCQCPAALEDRRRYQRDAMARRRTAGQPLIVNPTGTTRRLQALASVGWGFPYIGQRAGITAACISKIAHTNPAFVRRDNADAIAVIYEQLHTEDGPSPRQRTIAAKRGWLGPEYWPDALIDDPDAEPIDVAGARPATDVDHARVEQACAGRGQWHDMTKAELCIVVTRLNRRFYDDKSIGDMFAVSAKAVRYIRSTVLGLPAVPREMSRAA